MKSVIDQLGQLNKQCTLPNPTTTCAKKNPIPSMSEVEPDVGDEVLCFGIDTAL